MKEKPEPNLGGRTYARFAGKVDEAAPAPTHKYAVGDTVQFFLLRGPLLTRAKEKDISGNNDYTVVRQLPNEGGGFQYRIKSESSRQERLVTESEITPKVDE